MLNLVAVYQQRVLRMVLDQHEKDKEELAGAFGKESPQQESELPTTALVGAVEG
jgi:hypothetical protein